MPQESVGSPAKRVVGSGRLSSRLTCRRGGNQLRIGLVGYPNAGRSSLYNVMMVTGRCGESSPDELGFPATVDDGLFTTVDPNITTFTLADERHDYLRKVYAPVLEDQDDADSEDDADLMTATLLNLGTAAGAATAAALSPAGGAPQQLPPPQRQQQAARGRPEVSFADTGTSPLRGGGGGGAGGAGSVAALGSSAPAAEVKVGQRVPGAGNRVTLIDPAAFVPGSLSHSGLMGGVIGGPRGEPPRQSLAVGPGGLPVMDSVATAGLGYSDCLALAHADALVVVLRGFADDKLTHYHETVDPVRDFHAVHTELMARDVERLEAALLRLARFVGDGTGGSDTVFEYDTLMRAWEHLTGTSRGALTQRLVVLLDRLSAGSVASGKVDIDEEQVAARKYSPAKLRSPDRPVPTKFKWNEGIGARCLGKDIRTRTWSGGEADVLAKHQLLTAKGIVAALNVSAVDYLRGPGRNPYHARLLEVTAAANVPLLTLSVEFEQRYVHAVAQHGRDRFLRANPSHTSAVLPLVHTCLTAMDLIVVYTLQTVGGEGGEKANEAILARAAGGHDDDDDDDEAGTVGAEGSGLALVATAGGDGGGGDDDDDDDDAPVELGRGKGVTMEVTTVSTWIVPLGATVEDICALARGTETARLVRKADVLAHDHLAECNGDVVKARLDGLIFSRNKAYILVDGDVVSNFML